MRIGIEAQRIFRKNKHGMDMMAVELIKNLQKLDRVNDYFIFVNPDEDAAIIKPTSNFTIVPLPKSPYPIWEQFFLRRAIKRYKLDLIHCTSNTAPFKVEIPLILTLHDIIYLEKLDWRSGSRYQQLGNFYRRWNVPRIVKPAAKILTVSHYEEKRIKKYFHLNDQKIEVVYNGVGKHFKPMESGLAEVKRSQYGLPEKYVLFLGNTDPKKNLEGLLQAFKILRDRNELNLELVITDFSEEALLNILTILRAENLRDKIHLTGYVPNLDLPVFYNNALFFLYISLRESFGLPILEAMACGCPVITSTTSSMPEVAGDAALLIDPMDYAAISQAIVNLSINPDLRKKMKEKGLKRPLLFNYKNSVERILDIYQEVYNERHE